MPRHITAANTARWTRILESTGRCVMTAAARTHRTPSYVQRWYAVIYGAQPRCGSRSTLNQDQVDELIAARRAKVRLIHMAHRFGVSMSTLQAMQKKYGCPALRAPRGSLKRAH
jgi:hypothetical protein